MRQAPFHSCGLSCKDKEQLITEPASCSCNTNPKGDDERQRNDLLYSFGVSPIYKENSVLVGDAWILLFFLCSLMGLVNQGDVPSNSPTTICPDMIYSKKLIRLIEILFACCLSLTIFSHYQLLKLRNFPLDFRYWQNKVPNHDTLFITLSLRMLNMHT